jgi:hypothetical protein
MADNAAQQAAKVASLYARGVLTRQESVTKLVLLAAESHPSSLAAALPEELVAEIREACQRPPADPSGSPIIFGIGVGDLAAWRLWTSQAWYDGAWAWHQYLDA